MDSDVLVESGIVEQRDCCDCIAGMEEKWANYLFKSL
jgi:hypothetical protein